ncbi:MAG: AmmeMemoRadiSam system protein B [Candidatus Methanomethylicus sp.]|nr:AmmeMemoRadiSam system protein B [Candidatus Methanomethylicus sp.]
MANMNLRDRRPQVSNSFYEGKVESLSKQIEWCFLHQVGPGKLPSKPTSSSRSITAIVSPHAGYVYSGPIAAHGYLELSKEPVPEIIVVIGPNHTGMGAGVSVWGGGEWELPFGKIQIDRVMAKSLACSGIAEVDETAHLYEHSIEVQLPFLQYLYGSNFKLIPICMMLQDAGTSIELGLGLAEMLKGKSALVVASTDFSHYVPYAMAYKKDAMVSEAILSMDPLKVGKVVREERITMCGPGPVMAAMAFSVERGAKSFRKLCYATSGDTSGDKDAVVGYGSFCFF